MGSKQARVNYLPADWSEKLDHLFSMLKGLAFTPVIELGSYLWTLSKQHLTLSSILLSGIYGITWLISLCSFFASFDPAYSWKKRLLILTLGFGMLFFGVPLICGFLIGVNGIVKLTVIGIALSLMVTCWVLVPYLAETIEDVVKSVIENFRPSPQSETSEPPSSNLNAHIKTSATSTKEVVGEIVTRQKKGRVKGKLLDATNPDLPVPTKTVRKSRAKKPSPTNESPTKMILKKRNTTKKLKDSAPSSLQIESDPSLN